MSELNLNVPEGVNAHLMWEDSNPPQRTRKIARVGYWLANDEKGEEGATEWFDVDGDEADAQDILNGQALPHLLDAVASQIDADAVKVVPPTPIEVRREAVEKARSTVTPKAEKAESKKGKDKTAPKE